MLHSNSTLLLLGITKPSILQLTEPKSTPKLLNGVTPLLDLFVESVGVITSMMLMSLLIMLVIT